MNDTTPPSERKSRLAIIGGGSSGLISLKYAVDELTDWDITCFEKSGRIIGCWGDPYPNFTSTSTKYTTQFSCNPRYDSSVNTDKGVSRSEFFRNDEYGQYLEDFAKTFNLTPHIQLHSEITNISRAEKDSGWDLRIISSRADGPSRTEHFDQVIVATGLTAKAKSITNTSKSISKDQLNSHDGMESITGKRIVVIGGGESAVDYAYRLASDDLDNTVYLSLRGGIRVSPRYHPVRGVPSDFLRNRLMLSIDPDIRNAIGQKFVEWRIKHQELFERLFPGAKAQDELADEEIRLKKSWAAKLTATAKDSLFNMFHNKSDDFLSAVANKRITIIGEPSSETHDEFYDYDSKEVLAINPDLIVPSIGYESTFNTLSDGALALEDFYLGCTHSTYPDIHAVGFARPIIGNIPSISEMQAKYVSMIISGKISQPENISDLHAANQKDRAERYKTLPLETIYAVEMFPYCDHLAKLMGIYPACTFGQLLPWLRMQLMPATTLHYLPYQQDPSATSKVYMPPLLIVILLVLKPYDLIRKLWVTLTNQKRMAY